MGSKTHKESTILYTPCFINNIYYDRIQFSNFNSVISSNKSLLQNRKVTICIIFDIDFLLLQNTRTCRIFCKDSHELRQKSQKPMEKHNKRYELTARNLNVTEQGEIMSILFPQAPLQGSKGKKSKNSQ